MELQQDKKDRKVNLLMEQNKPTHKKNPACHENTASGSKICDIEHGLLGSKGQWEIIQRPRRWFPRQGLWGRSQPEGGKPSF